MSQTQKLLLNACISIILTALVAALQAVLQLHSGTDQIDFAVMINTALVVFAGSFWPALMNYVPAHIQDELQALRDLQSQISGKKPDPAPVATTPAEEPKQLV